MSEIGKGFMKTCFSKISQINKHIDLGDFRKTFKSKVILWRPSLLLYMLNIVMEFDASENHTLVY